MAIRKGNKMLQVSVPSDVIDSMDKVVSAMSERLGRRITKGMLITDIYVEWLEFQNKQIEKHREDKKDA